MGPSFQRSSPPQAPRLRDGAEVIVVGGGPAGSFFALRLLGSARQQGKEISVSIVDKNPEAGLSSAEQETCCKEGCNYCAGGLSPRLMEALENEGLDLPEAIRQAEVKTLTIQGHWKNIELEVPQGRKMICVFRGSRPMMRPHRYINLDGYLLQQAACRGAAVVTGDVTGIRRSAAGLPRVLFNHIQGGRLQAEEREADFVVVAGGVNRWSNTDPMGGPFGRSLTEVLPGFVPPRVRKTLIFELEGRGEFLRAIQGEVHFVEYGSDRLRIEMSSIMPKGGYVTVVLIGPSIDRASPGRNREIADQYLDLPQIRKLLPREARLRVVCMCSPDMTVGAARRLFADRVAVIGDLAVSRLYKDGIYSAYLTASGLADSVLGSGVDDRSLRKRYRPIVDRLRNDNRYGRFVFLLNRIAFSRPVLGRILYQAVIGERKRKDKDKRRLAEILWKIASGDDSYKRIFVMMLRPESVLTIFVGGVLVTLRNYLTERLFGLKWGGFGRYPTAVPKEQFQDARRELSLLLDLPALVRPLEYERMYAIRIKGDRKNILDQLGKFGDGDRGYFRPRILRVHRVQGGANETGSVISYEMPFRFLSFRIVLERIVEETFVLYRVQDGFAQGGVLVFKIDDRAEGTLLLSIFVAFDFVRGDSIPTKLARRAFRLLFPGFVHDVLWNHSLCELRDIVESWRREASSALPDDGVHLLPAEKGS
jgi:flavin-dependent dehydrogenase